MGETDKAPMIEPMEAPLVRVIKKFENVENIDFSLFAQDPQTREIKTRYFDLYEKMKESEDDYIQSKKPEKGIFVFDFEEFCKKYDMDLEKVRAMYEEVRGLTSFDSKAREYYRTDDYELLDVKYVGIERLVDYINNYTEEELFTKWCRGGNLVLTNVRNVHRIDHKKMNDNGDYVTKTIATYTKPKIENVTYFNGEKFENQLNLIFKDIEIDLTDDINSFDDFIKTVKKTGNFPYEQYLHEYNRLFEYVIKRYKEDAKMIKRTGIYGYFGEEKNILHGWESDKDSPRAKDFKELLKMDPEEEEVKELLIDLKKYFGSEDFIKIIFEYGLASIFRYDLMNPNNKKLHKFPFLLVIGKQAIGKTARMNLVFNKLLLNSNTPYLNDDLEGSKSKMAKEQFINLPMWFDELEEFPPQMKELIKQMATQQVGIVTRGNKNVTKADHVFLIRRPFIISTNKFKIHDPALMDRFIVLSAYDYELENNSEISQKILPDVNKIGAWIFKNIELLKKHIDTLEYDFAREEANNNTIMIGREIAKTIYGHFGLEYEPSTKIIYGDSNISTSNDKLKKIILSEAISLSTWLEAGVKRNILDYIEDEKYDMGKLQLQKYGIFVKKDRLNNCSLLITKTALEYMNLEDEGIKTLAEFEAHNFKRCQHWHDNKNHYCVQVPIGDHEDDPEKVRIKTKMIEILEKNNENGEKTHIAEVTFVIRELFDNRETEELDQIIEEIIAEMNGVYITTANDYMEYIKNPVQKTVQ